MTNHNVRGYLWTRCEGGAFLESILEAGASIGTSNSTESLPVGSSSSAIPGDDGKGIGDAEAEALTVGPIPSS